MIVKFPSSFREMTDILNVHTGATSVANQKSDVKKYMENLKPDLPDEQIWGIS